LRIETEHEKLQKRRCCQPERPSGRPSPKPSGPQRWVNITGRDANCIGRQRRRDQWPVGSVRRAVNDEAVYVKPKAEWLHLAATVARSGSDRQCTSAASIFGL
jgi:hypothetical protein